MYFNFRSTKKISKHNPYPSLFRTKSFISNINFGLKFRFYFLRVINSSRHIRRWTYPSWCLKGWPRWLVLSCNSRWFWYSMILSIEIVIKHKTRLLNHSTFRSPLLSIYLYKTSKGALPAACTAIILSGILLHMVTLFLDYVHDEITLIYHARRQFYITISLLLRVSIRIGCLIQYE